MIAIVWRGAGIVVPIITILVGWILSFWYEDTRLLDSEHFGWTLFISGILLALIGLGLSTSEVDGETGEKLPKGKHDFFYIPVVFWGIAFFGFGIYNLWIKGSPEDYDYGELDTEIVDEGEVADEFANDDDHYVTRKVNLYNGSDEDLEYIFYSDIKNDAPHEGTLESNKFLNIEVDAGYYCAQSKNMDGESVFNQNVESNKDLFDKNPDNWKKEFIRAAKTSIYKRRIAGSTYDYKDYDEAWLCIDSIHNFLLLDVKDVCESGWEDDDFDYVDWMDEIVEWYDGRDLIEPVFKQDRHGMTITVIGPWLRIPLYSRPSEKVYAIIAYEKGQEVDQEFLAKRVRTLYNFNFND